MQNLTVAQVLALLFLHLGGVAVVAGYCAAWGGLLPALNERAVATLRTRLWLPVLIGLLISIPWVLAAIFLINKGARAGQIGAILGMAWILIGLIGCSAIARVIGSSSSASPRLTQDPLDPDQPSLLRTTCMGGLILALTWALPLIGWYFILPISIATGVGCVVLGLRSRG